MLTTQILTRTVDAMNTFSDFLETETDALRQMKVSVVSEDMKKKEELTLVVEEYLKSLLDNPLEMTRVTTECPDMKIALAQGWTRFTKSMADNITALERMRRTSERVTEMIVGAARQAHATHYGYAVTPKPRHTASVGLSMAFDRKM